MLYRRSVAAFLSGCLLLFATACEDDLTGVGGGVGPDLRGGEPQTIEVLFDTLETADLASVTGSPEDDATWRVLFGQVDDPLTGPVRADGYVDFAQADSLLLSDALLSADASEVTASLQIAPGYLHGDSTAALTVDVYPLADELDLSLARGDTSFARTDSLIGSAQFVPGADTLVSVELSSSWLANNLATIQDTTGRGDAFDEIFHGFRLEARSGPVVTGASQANVGLLLVVDEDTTRYPSVRSFTSLSRSGPPTTTLDDRLVVAPNQAARFTPNATALDTLTGSSVNSADLTLITDTTALAENTPTGTFVRPRPSGFRLFGLLAEGAPSCRQLNLLDVNLPGGEDACVIGNDPTVSPNRLLAPSSVLRGIYDFSVRNGETIFREFRVDVVDRASTPSGLNQTLEVGIPTTAPIVFYRDAADVPARFRPQLVITVTPR